MSGIVKNLSYKIIWMNLKYDAINDYLTSKGSTFILKLSMNLKVAKEEYAK